MATQAGDIKWNPRKYSIQKKIENYVKGNKEQIEGRLKTQEQ